jgi:hypothetical protein
MRRRKGKRIPAEDPPLHCSLVSLDLWKMDMEPRAQAWVSGNLLVSELMQPGRKRGSETI